MKNSKTALLAAVVLLALAGCKKEQAGEPTDFTVIIESPAGTDSKVTMGTGDYVRKPCWTMGDAIKINNSTDAHITTIRDNPTVAQITTSTLTTNPNGPYYAVYPASAMSSAVTASPSISLPRVQEYKLDDAEGGTGKQIVDAPMAAYNPSNKVLQFKNLCSVVEISVTNDKAWDMIVDSIHIEASNKSLWGEMQLLSNDQSNHADYNTIQSTTPYLQVLDASAAIDPDRSNGRLLGRAALESAKRIVSLAKANDASIDEPVAINGTKKFYMYLPAIPAEANCQLTIRVFTHPNWSNWTASENKKVHIVYSRTTNNITLPRNQFWAIDYTLSNTNPTFTSMKAFSVASGTQVCFSRGNLQYYNPVTTSGTHTRSNTNVNNTNARYRFAPRQWSFLGQTNITVFSAAHNAVVGWREYFPWGTGDNPVYFASSNTLQHVASNLSGNNYQHDWGYYITNLMTGDYHGANNRVWRTPTRSEYDYVFKSTSRNTTDNVKYGWATISDPKYGVVIDRTHGTEYTYGDATKRLHGCILIPDNVTASELKGGSTGTGSFVHGENREGHYYYNYDNQYTTAQFEYLEAKGCIFFPCIGFFVLTSGGVGNDTPHRNWTKATAQGRYWGSSNGYVGSSEISTTQAALMWFQAKDLGLTTSSISTGNDDETGAEDDTEGNDWTSTSAGYDDPCRYLDCVRLVCPASTQYYWDPDQM